MTGIHDGWKNLSRPAKSITSLFSLLLIFLSVGGDSIVNNVIDKMFPSDCTVDSICCCNSANHGANSELIVTTGNEIAAALESSIEKIQNSIRYSGSQIATEIENLHDIIESKKIPSTIAIPEIPSSIGIEGKFIINDWILHEYLLRLIEKSDKSRISLEPEK